MKFSRSILGQRFIIKKLSQTVQPHTRLRLIALGLCPGADFTIQQIAPFGGPVLIKLNSSLLSLRRHELDLLIIETLT